MIDPRLRTAMMGGPPPAFQGQPGGLEQAMMPTPASAAPNAFTAPVPQEPRPVAQPSGPMSNALAEALMASAYQGQNRNWFEALGNLGKLFSGSKMNEQYAQAEAKRQAEAAAAKREQDLADFDMKRRAGLEDFATQEAIKANYSKGDKLPGSVQEYQFYADQMRAAGQEPLPFDQFQIAQKKAGATSVTTNVGGEQLTPGQKKIDEAFADEYVEWVSKGGFADVDKQIKQLGEALAIIETNPGITGPTIGLVPDYLQPYFNEQGVIARNAVEEVVQRNLRAILGAQFTEKEGERLIARAYNPQLPPAENARRVRALMTQIGAMGQAKQASVDYFNEHGTLRGYTGARPSVADLDKISFGDAPQTPPAGAAAPATPAAPAASGPPPGVDPDLWEFMTPEQRALWN